MTRDRIVELAAAHAPADDRLAGSAYSSVVAVDPQILQERGGAASLETSQHIGLVRTGRYTRALPRLKQNARRPPSLKVQARDALKHELQDDTAHSSFKGASCRSIWLLQALAGPARLKQVALILP